MRLALVLVLLWSAPVLADARPTDEPTAADVADAPLPGAEGGRTDQPKGDSVLRNIGQGALFAPRVALEVAFAPVRVSLWAYDRYRIGDRFTQIFFDDSETYGLYPTFVLDSSYGVTFGGRFVHRNLLGDREHFALRGGGGGEFRARIDGHLRSGRRFGDRVEAEVKGELERRPNDPFYGIGNSSEDMALYHRQALLRGTLTTDVRLVRSLYVRAAGAITDLEYAADDEGMPIDVVYGDTLTGWGGVRNLYGELELRWDSRGGAARFDEHGVYETGWLLAAYGGRVHQLEAGRDYWRYGGDIQHFLRIGVGPRALAGRLHLDSVTGEIEDVAFTELPQLGGKMSLRGYPRERFRDRTAVVGSVEYEWDIGRLLMASLFVDAGRVFATLREPVPTKLRVGYGVSLQFHSRNRYRAGLTLASSIDGGIFLDLSFDPVFDVEPRVEQR